jgi:geranylgeranyl diphosphate synthase type II
MIDFSRYHSLFTDYLQKHPLVKVPHTLYEPADYILALGGKRLRPVFALMGSDLYSQNTAGALKVAMAVEVFHNFTLVHDDIMDQSDIRRGKPTVHKKYDINTAILSGDVMLIKSYEYLLDHSDPVLVKSLLNEFNKMAVEVCEGQQYDVDFENRDDVTIQQYLHMITLKTAVLLACSLKMGAMVGGASESDCTHLYEFAKNYGIAFQLQDDYLDTFGNADEVGKKIGGDIIKNKKTYLYLKALELCDDHQQQTLRHLYSELNVSISDDEKITTVTQIFRKTHVEEYSKQLIEVYRDLAYSHLSACKIDENSRNQIGEYMNGLLFRKY